jgi:hypothetical protein
MNSQDIILDMTGKKIEFGHIVAVRYVCNSYVGIARMKGLCSQGAKRFAFFSPHSYEDYATYQILCHIDKDHKDFNEAVCNWYTSEEGECPIKIIVYNNLPVSR